MSEGTQEPPVRFHLPDAGSGRGAVATIELNRPERLNAINDALVEGLAEALETARREESRVVVLTGRGRSFCSGHDLREPVTDRGPEDTRRRLERLQDLTRAIKDSRFPVIAAVEGHAVGAGCEIALACDLLVAGRGATFAFPEVGVGLGVTNGVTQLLGSVMGPQRAKHLLLTGDRFGAADARSWGLASEVVDDGTALSAALHTAERVARQPPVAVMLAKRLVDEGMGASLGEALDTEVRLSLQLDPAERQPMPPREGPR